MEKTEIIKNLNLEKTHPLVRNMLELMDILIQENRIDNDTAGEDLFKLNQGKIIGMLILKDYINKGPVGYSNQ